MPSRCPPSASAALSMAFSTEASSRTSQWKLWMPPAKPSVARRARPATWAPASTACRAIASPMPALEPVTRIRRPLRDGASAIVRILLRKPGFEAFEVLRRPLRDQHPAPEAADPLAVLVVGAGLDQDRPAVRLRLRFGHLQHGGLRIDGVAVEGRVLVLERVDLEVGDRLARDVGNAHPERQRVDEVADHHVAAELRALLRVVRVGVERVVVHGDRAKEVVVGLGDGLAGPVPVRRSDLELLQVTPELAHRLASSHALPMTRSASTSSEPSKMASTRASTK